MMETTGRLQSLLLECLRFWLMRSYGFSTLHYMDTLPCNIREWNEPLTVWFLFIILLVSDKIRGKCIYAKSIVLENSFPQNVQLGM